MDFRDNQRALRNDFIHTSARISDYDVLVLASVVCIYYLETYHFRLYKIPNC